MIPKMPKIPDQSPRHAATIAPTAMIAIHVNICIPHLSSCVYFHLSILIISHFSFLFHLHIHLFQFIYHRSQMLLNQFCTFPDKCLIYPIDIVFRQKYIWNRIRKLLFIIGNAYLYIKILQVDSECQPVTIQKFVLFFY